MEITTVYQKVRNEFGRPVNTFMPSESQLLDEFLPEKELLGSYIERNPSVLDVQAMPEMSEHEVNTERFSYLSIGMFHQEGGWPKDVDATEKEQTLRYIKRVVKDEDYVRQINNLGDAVESSIMQNYAIDIYQEYFSGEYADHSSEPPSAKTLSVFKDPNEIKRTVSHISWNPDGGRKLAVAFSIMQFQDWRMEQMSMKSYIWDVNNPNTPDMELVPSSPLCCLEYNPKDTHVLVGGSYNGLVSMFDTRKGTAPSEISIIENSHRDPVYDIAWLSGKTAYECFSTSTDGQVLFWDIRRPETALDSLLLEDKTPGNEGRTMGGVSMEFSAAAGPTKFLVGTEQGKVVQCNRKAKNPSDRIGTIYEGHCGPVYALQRNPFFPKYFLTIGDWTVRLWNEEIKHPIMTSKYFKNYLLDAAWSPTRPGVFLTTKMDGTLDVWDYFYKQNDPTLSLQVDEDGLFTVKIQEAGNLLATGSVDGSVYMLELCEGLSAMQSNEKSSVMQMLERESKREKNLEARQKELRQKEKRQTEMAAADPSDKQPWEEQVKTLEEKFWASIQQSESKAEADASTGA
mmetsp:Transcript_49227/g.110719  ORF Transcript_49227/g.110719 Transcript_49227/m.110719 type:complete len:570 (-) Transcript_49227:356-2065(-)